MCGLRSMRTSITYLCNMIWYKQMYGEVGSVHYYVFVGGGGVCLFVYVHVHTL